jgi:hypothetical protein
VALSLGAWVLLARPGGFRSLAAGFAVGSACWLREELALMVPAVACASLLCGRRSSDVVALASGAALPVAGLLALNERLYGSLLGPHIHGNLGPGVGASLTGSALAAGDVTASLTQAGRQLASLWAGLGQTPAEATLLVLAAIGAFAIGWIGTPRGRGSSGLAWLLTAVGLGAWLLGFASVLRAERPFLALVLYNGLLVQMPMFAVAGLGLAIVRRVPGYESLRLGTLAGLLFLLLSTGLGLALFSAVGFGVHWGPRPILPVLPAVAALFLAAARGDPVAARAGFALPRAAAISLMAAGVLSSVHATWFLAQQKTEGEFVQNRILARPQDVVVTVNPLLTQHLPPLWHRKRMLLVQSNTELVHLARQLARHEVRDVLLLLPPATPVVDRIEGIRCRPAGQHRGRRLHYHDLDLQECEIGARARPRKR